MKLNKLLGIVTVSLTTTAAAVTIPKKYEGTSVLLMAAQLDDSFISWRRCSTATAATSKLCPEQDIVIPINVSGDTVIFYAKTTTGTGTLEIECWK